MSIDRCECDGIRDILKTILMIQEKACEKVEILETCEKPFLGPCGKPAKCNTRPIMLFTKIGTPWEFPYGDLCQTSKIFRLEKLDQCKATFRVLVPVTGGGSTRDIELDVADCGGKDKKPKKKFEATESFFTINLDCICAIKCLKDTFVEDVC